MFEASQPVFGVPTMKNMTLGIKKFDGSEPYKGLGANFAEWGTKFMRHISMAQINSGFWWSSDHKIDCLSSHLDGKALRYFESQYPTWMKTWPFLEYIMDQMLQAYRVRLTMEQALNLFQRPKPKTRSWREHYIYLTEVSHASGGHPELVLESIVKHASSDMRPMLMAKVNMDSNDYLVQAERLSNFAQAMTLEDRVPRNLGREVNAIEEDSIQAVEELTCSYCKRNGHRVEDCRTKKRDNGSTKKPTAKKSQKPKKKDSESNKEKNWTLFVTDRAPDDAICTSTEKEEAGSYESVGHTTEWILDSGCGRHLTGNASLLSSDIATAGTSLFLPDGTTVKSTKKGTVNLKTFIGDESSNVQITDVELVPGLKKNLLSYVRLERKGIRLIYEGKHRFLASQTSKLAEVFESGNLLVVRFQPAHTHADSICALIAEQDHPKTHEDSLYQFHVRLGHLSYAAIEELASKPESGIKLTDHEKPQCITCAEGKQTRGNQSQKDSGRNAPINRIGGVICSDLKGPITPTDRNGNRYMVNFIDYKTNYCRVFLAKTKDQAAKKFEHFLAWFERRFDCRIQVLRTDGGLEYKNVDLFCQKTGVARQFTEPNSPASNGKAERMHRTVLNMARCMIFNCGLPIRFWGDAVKYAAYVLNRSPSRSNPGRKSPLEVLEGKPPSLLNIVAFGSPCMVYRDSNGRTFKKRATRGIILGSSDGFSFS